MSSYAILSNRKRAVIALVHSIFFFMVALMSFLGHTKTGLFFSHSRLLTDWALLGIYLIVTTILLMLVRASNCVRERLYFAFCATSASFGLLRIVFGDSHVWIAQYVRVGMLACAVLTGYMIMKRHSQRSMPRAAPAISYSE